MFSLYIYKCLVKYSMISVLLECMTSVQAVERWVDEDHVRSGRKLLEYVDDTSDIMIFFVVLVVGLLITTPLIRYLCQNGYCGDGSNYDADISAVVHPPPRQLVQQPQLHVAYANSGFVHSSQVVLSPVPPSLAPGVVDDKPPDYSTVVMGDMAQGAHQTPYPRVAVRDENRLPNSN